MLLSVYSRHRKTVFSVAATVLSFGLLPTAGWAQTGKPDASDKNEVAKVEWSKLAEAKELDPQASIEKMDEQIVLKVVRVTSQPQLIPLATLKEPKILEKAYVLRGKVRVEGVVGDGYLEMWNHFPEPKPGAFFTRTMAGSGSMGKLKGTAPWREFALPFMIDDKSYPAPNKLQVNVYLPDKGTVWLTDLIVEEMPIAKLQKELQGSAMVLPSWFWGVLSSSIILPILAVVGFVVFVKKFRKHEHGTELRRMKALDLG